MTEATTTLTRDRTAVCARLPYSLTDRAIGRECELGPEEIFEADQAVTQYFGLYHNHRALHDAIALMIAWQTYAKHPAIWQKILDRRIVKSLRINCIGRIKRAPNGNYEDIGAFVNLTTKLQHTV